MSDFHVSCLPLSLACPALHVITACISLYRNGISLWHGLSMWNLLKVFEIQSGLCKHITNAICHSRKKYIAEKPLCVIVFKLFLFTFRYALYRIQSLCN